MLKWYKCHLKRGQFFPTLRKMRKKYILRPFQILKFLRISKFRKNFENFRKIFFDVFGFSSKRSVRKASTFDQIRRYSRERAGWSCPNVVSFKVDVFEQLRKFRFLRGLESEKTTTVAPRRGRDSVIPRAKLKKWGFFALFTFKNGSGRLVFFLLWCAMWRRLRHRDAKFEVFSTRSVI